MTFLRRAPFIRRRSVGGGAVTYDTDINIAASGTVTIPSGVTTLVLEVWSAGGGGGSSAAGVDGGGGGGGGYTKTTFTVSSSAGKTIQYSRGTKGTGGPIPGGDGTQGGSSTASSGITNPFSMLNISITGGTGGISGVSGGTWGVGGIVTNNNSNTTSTDGVDGFLSAGGPPINGDNSNFAGAGGDGAAAGGNPGNDGANGRVIFTFT